MTLAILWLMTGSVVLPVKALLMNALTTATATGLLVFVFQDGRLQGVLDYVGQGGIEQTDFLVLAAIVFALSTDYGVLLMTRIKEARDGGRDNRRGDRGRARAHRAGRHRLGGAAGGRDRRVRHLARSSSSRRSASVRWSRCWSTRSSSARRSCPR